MNRLIERAALSVMDGQQLDCGSIEDLVRESRVEPEDFLYWADRIRRKFFII